MPGLVLHDPLPGQAGEITKHSERDKGFPWLPAKNPLACHGCSPKTLQLNYIAPKYLKQILLKQNSTKYAAYQCVVCFFSTRNYWYKWISVCKHLDQGLAHKETYKSYVSLC